MYFHETRARTTAPRASLSRRDPGACRGFGDMDRDLKRTQRRDQHLGDLIRTSQARVEPHQPHSPARGHRPQQILVHSAVTREELAPLPLRTPLDRMGAIPGSDAVEENFVGCIEEDDEIEQLAPLVPRPLPPPWIAAAARAGRAEFAEQGEPKERAMIEDDDAIRARGSQPQRPQPPLEVNDRPGLMGDPPVPTRLPQEKRQQ